MTLKSPLHTSIFVNDAGASTSYRSLFIPYFNSNITHHANPPIILENNSPAENSTLYYIAGYALISLFSLIVGILNELWDLHFFLIGSRGLHRKLLNSVLGSPLRFFDKTPIGRILNRFTKDIGEIDIDFVGDVISFVQTLFQILTTIMIVVCRFLFDLMSI